MASSGADVSSTWLRQAAGTCEICHKRCERTCCARRGVRPRFCLGADGSGTRTRDSASAAAITTGADSGGASLLPAWLSTDLRSRSWERRGLPPPSGMSGASDASEPESLAASECDRTAPAEDVDIGLSHS